MMKERKQRGKLLMKYNQRKDIKKWGKENVRTLVP